MIYAYLKHKGGIIGGIVAKLWRLNDLFWNGIDDLFILLMAVSGFFQHYDLFNLSVILGKCLKISFQFYIDGFFFQNLNQEYTPTYLAV